MNLIGNLKMWARPLICPFDEILNYLPEGVSSFDIECGTGYLLARIAAEKNPTALGGIEITGQLIQFARKRVREFSRSVPLDLFPYDGCNLPWELSNYDYIWMIDVMHHIPRQAQSSTIKAIAAKMKSHAVLIFKDIDAGRPVLCLANKLHDLISSGEMGHEQSRADAGELLRQVGLDVSIGGTKRMWVYPHYWYVCHKQ